MVWFPTQVFGSGLLTGFVFTKCLSESHCILVKNNKTYQSNFFSLLQGYDPELVVVQKDSKKSGCSLKAEEFTLDQKSDTLLLRNLKSIESFDSLQIQRKNKKSVQVSLGSVAEVFLDLSPASSGRPRVFLRGLEKTLAMKICPSIFGP